VLKHYREALSSRGETTFRLLESAVVGDILI
jgi:hypothetical protein